MTGFARGLGAVFAIVALACGLGLSAQTKSQSPSSSKANEDRFVGTWKFNPDKSSRSGIVSEQIAIEVQGDQFKFTCDWLGENGTELHWWYVTAMKGEKVKHTQVNGQPMTSESRVTRLDSHSFRDESEILKDEYKISGDGQTLTIRRKYFIRPVNSKAPDHLQLVFDRQR